MGYGASPTRWTVNTIDTEGNPKFDLQVGDILEFTGSGDSMNFPSVTRRHRSGSPSIDWGDKCAYNAKHPAVAGVYNACPVTHSFLILIQLGTSSTWARHTGHILPQDPGTGGAGTWTAVESG
jgi:hypothetical protein